MPFIFLHSWPSNSKVHFSAVQESDWRIASASLSFTATEWEHRRDHANSWMRQYCFLTAYSLTASTKSQSPSDVLYSKEKYSKCCTSESFITLTENLSLHYKIKNYWAIFSLRRCEWIAVRKFSVLHIPCIWPKLQKDHSEYSFRSLKRGHLCEKKPGSAATHKLVFKDFRPLTVKFSISGDWPRNRILSGIFYLFKL